MERHVSMFSLNSARLLLLLLWAFLIPCVQSFSSGMERPFLRHRNKLANKCKCMSKHERHDESNKLGVENQLRRRDVIHQLWKATTVTSVVVGGAPQISSAGEVGARLNAAVTQSDLGVSVRRSVVRGAQVMDKLDGQWEKFSDEFGLGAERSKRDARPKPKEIPDLLPLNQNVATEILNAADMVFISLVPIGQSALMKEVNEVDGLVRNSFERAGLEFGKEGESPIMRTGPQFNYMCYVRFKAYSNILISRNVNFQKFRKGFENDLGLKLLSIFVPDNTAMPEITIPGETKMKQEQGFSVSSSEMKENLQRALDLVDHICDSMKSKGLLALTERSELDKDKIQDWSEDLSDLQFSIALDGDVTLDSQILLQEQGFRLYPDFTRFAVTASLRKVLGNLNIKQDVTSEEYYMDTNYNSDPDLFDAKEVLLNIVIESS